MSVTVPVLTESTQLLLESSVEYAHLYADEVLTREHLRAEQLAHHLGAGHANKVRVMLVDDYNVHAAWDPLELEDQLAVCPPDLIFSEADFESAARVLLHALPEGRARSGVVRWMRQHDGKTPCSLLTAAWYLVRLGIMPGPLDRLRGQACPPARSLMNVLPVAYRKSEERAANILNAYRPGLSNYVLIHWQVEDPFLHFKPESYHEDNFAGEPLEADRIVVHALSRAWKEIGSVEKAIEIGAGANLYPIELAHEHVDDLHVTDHAPAAVQWLQEKLAGLDPSVTIGPANIYDLPPDTYDVVSMHSVAESITESRDTFAKALASVRNALKPDGHLLASFMLGSSGWEVAGANFPAVRLSKPDALIALEQAGLHVSWSEDTPPVREDSAGILFVKAQR